MQFHGLGAFLIFFAVDPWFSKWGPGSPSSPSNPLSIVLFFHFFFFKFVIVVETIAHHFQSYYIIELLQLLISFEW